MSFLRRRKATANGESHIKNEDDKNKKRNFPKKERYNNNSNNYTNTSSRKKWSCWDSCCRFIGFICSLWWFLLLLLNTMPASIPQYVTEAITGPLTDPPGFKQRKEGLTVNHPVVFVPGIVTGGLELWEGHHCAEGLFRKRLWGGSFGELYKRYGGEYVEDSIRVRYAQRDPWLIVEENREFVSLFEKFVTEKKSVEKFDDGGWSVTRFSRLVRCSFTSHVSIKGDDLNNSFF